MADVSAVAPKEVPKPVSLMDILAAPSASGNTASPRHVSSSNGVEVKDSTGVKVKDSIGVEVKDSTGLNDKDSIGVKDEDSTGLNDKDSIGVKDEDSTGLNDKDSDGGVNDKDSTGVKDKDSIGLNDKDSTGLNGKDSDGVNNKDSDGGVKDKDTTGLKDKDSDGSDGVKDKDSISVKDKDSTGEDAAGDRPRERDLPFPKQAKLFTRGVLDLFPEAAMRDLMLALTEGGGVASMTGFAPRGWWISKEDDNAVQLKVAMPGLGKEHVKMRAEKNTLLIKGEADKDSEGGNDKAPAGYIYRIGLSSQAYKMDQIKAEMKNGVLILTVPKIKDEERKDVFEIKVE